ncbi:MAG: tyrosine phosphatase family protein [Caulobacterales bacterium]
MTLIVCPLSRLDDVIAERAPSHLITLLSPEEMIDTPDGFPRERHLRLGVHDIAIPQPGMTAPSAATVEEILAFAQGWDARSPMLVHCWAGISRSTATAFVLACERNPGADEVAIALAMRRAAPHAYPNRRIVALADDILDRRGRMLEAVEAMGGNNFVLEGQPFDVPLRR